MVVPDAHISQRGIELFAARERGFGQFPFHRANESFYAPILPGASGVDALVADSQQPEPKPKPAGDKHGFIVRPHELWPTIARHGLCKFLQQSHR